MNINKFAVCLLTPNFEVSKNQRYKIEHSYLKDKYDIEFWERCEKNTNIYPGFSNMINEAIEDTDSELMIFFSQKVEATPEEIDEAINKLNSGYCFVAVNTLGFFGASKEVFRNIGMFDERFIGGELEDDDIALRLNMLNKAVYWNVDYSQYRFDKGMYPLIRGTSVGKFLRKWNEKKETKEVFLSSKNVEKRISKRHSLRNFELYNSWKDKSYTYYSKIQDNPCTRITEYKVNLIDYEEKRDLCQCKFIIKVKNKSNAHIEFITDKEKTYPITFGIYCFSESERHPIQSAEVYPNTWHDLNFNLSTEKYEVRIYSDGDILYHNILDSDFEYSLDLNLYRYIKPI